jgi:hypothetical protein
VKLEHYLAVVLLRVSQFFYCNTKREIFGGGHFFVLVRKVEQRFNASLLLLIIECCDGESFFLFDESSSSTATANTTTGTSMAPIMATGTGIIPQRLDDERLGVLLESLRCIPNFTKNVADADVARVPCQRLLEQLVPLLEPLQSWVFEEQVRLNFAVE